jgi:acyl-CoA dehydrogenase
VLEWMLSRVNDERKRPFGRLLSEHGVILEWIAKSRIEIDAARSIVLNAAAKIDETNSKDARIEIVEAKILVLTMACTVIDRAVQALGAAGICQDTPLAFMWAQIRTVRIADGPDEVHLQQMGRYENKRGVDMQRKLEKQAKIVDDLFRRYGTKRIVAGSRL